MSLHIWFILKMTKTSLKTFQNAKKRVKNEFLFSKRNKKVNINDFAYSRLPRSLSAELFHGRRTEGAHTAHTNFRIVFYARAREINARPNMDAHPKTLPLLLRLRLRRLWKLLTLLTLPSLLKPRAARVGTSRARRCDQQKDSRRLHIRDFSSRESHISLYLLHSVRGALLI